MGHPSASTRRSAIALVARLARRCLPTIVAPLIALSASVPAIAQPVERPSAWGAAGAGPGPATLRMRLIRVMDNEGWEQPVEAFRLLLPADWGAQAWVRWSPAGINCPARLIDAGLQALAPDRITGFELMPTEAWRWVDDAQLRQGLQQQEANMQRMTGSVACPWSPITTAGEFLRQMVLPKRRGGAQVLGTEPDQALAQLFDAQVRPIFAPLVANRLVAGFRVDAARVRIGYAVAGAPVEEILTAAILSVVQVSPSIQQLSGGGGAPNRSTQSNAQLLVATRAPAGRGAEAAPLFATILGTFRANPQWLQAVESVRANLAAIARGGAVDRARIWREAGEEIARTQGEAWRRQQAVQSSLASQYSQTIRGVQSYADPTTGQPIELSGGYARAFANGRGEYILTNDALFDPAVALRENWRPMQPLGRQ